MSGYFVVVINELFSLFSLFGVDLNFIFHYCFDFVKFLFSYIVNTFIYIPIVNLEVLKFSYIKNSVSYYFNILRDVSEFQKISSTGVSTPSDSRSVINKPSHVLLKNGSSRSGSGRVGNVGKLTSHTTSSGSYNIIDSAEAERHNLRHIHRRSNLRAGCSTLHRDVEDIITKSSRVIMRLLVV